MRNVFGMVGVFMLVAGLALIGLGFGYVKGSFMTGDVTIWIGIGTSTAGALLVRLSVDS